MVLLIQNEVIKLLLKKKMVLIIILLTVFIGLFAYGERYAYDKAVERLEEVVSEGGSYDWTSLSTQRLGDLERRLDSPYLSDEGKKSLTIEIEQLSYFIENDINPITPSAAKFSVEFIEQGIMMFIPLLIVILAADLVSGEFATKTIKVLLTRAVPRKKILFSKYVALLIMTTILILIIAIITTIVSYMFFHRWGYTEPVATGFSSYAGSLISDSAILVTRFEYIILAYSLAWFVGIIMATITMMVSVLVKNTGSAIGILMATLIGGQFLQFFLGEWALVKYFFVTNLSLTRYLTGSYQPIEGMNLIFSMIVLTIWAVLALVISFQVFDRKDVLV